MPSSQKVEQERVEEWKRIEKDTRPSLAIVSRNGTSKAEA
jgi:hypothetical protein